MSKIQSGKPGQPLAEQYVRGVKVKTIVLPREVVEQIRAIQKRKREARGQ